MYVTVAPPENIRRKHRVTVHAWTFVAHPAVLNRVWIVSRVALPIDPRTNIRVRVKGFLSLLCFRFILRHTMFGKIGVPHTNTISYNTNEGPNQTNRWTLSFTCLATPWLNL